MDCTSKKVVKIKDLGRLVTGSTPPTQHKEYYGSEYPFIKPSDLSPGTRKIMSTETMLSQLGCELQNSKALPKHSTCVVCIGTIGKIGLTSRLSFTNQQINSVIVNEKSYDPLYVYYLLVTAIPKVKKLEGGSASGREHVKKSVFENIEVEVHSLPVQHRIAAILSAYDDLIENNTRRIKILEEMAQALYRELFVHFRFPGNEKVRMVDSPLGRIPEGWEIKKLGGVCQIVMGQSPKSEYYNVIGEGLPFHQGVTDFGSRFPTDRVYCTIQNRTSEVGDILFSVRAPVGRINIANKRIVIGRGLSAIRSKNGHQSFIFQQLKEIFLEEDSIGGGTIFKSVTRDDMNNIEIILPTDSLITEFQNIVGPMFSELENLIEKNANLQRTREILLPKLISGEICINETIKEGSM